MIIKNSRHSLSRQGSFRLEYVADKVELEQDLLLLHLFRLSIKFQKFVTYTLHSTAKDAA